MKRFVFLLLFVFLCLPLTAQQKRSQWEVGVEISDYKYKEPRGAQPMSLQGLKSGVNLSYTRHSVLSPYLNAQDPTFGKVEVRYMTGNVDYDGSVRDNYGVITPFKADNLKDYYWEIALKGGWVLQPAEPLELRPYLGIGWRYLRNHLEQAGPQGYFRTSTYLYLPLGMQTAFRLSERFSLGLNPEFDWLLTGQQYSDIGSGLTHTQTAGYGLRLSLRAEMDFDHTALFAEPFWRYWQIQNSQSSGGYLEPLNKTQEWGINVGLTF